MFFNKNSQNFIDFWNCPSNAKWTYHVVVNKKTKQFNLTFILLYKLSWDFNKKNEYNSIIYNWQMMFQVSDLKEKHFLNLDNEYLPVNSTYIKDGLWLKQISHLNSLYTRATRVTTNHAPINKYQLRFFLREIFSCLYRTYPIKSRYHILYECRRYNI